MLIKESKDMNNSGSKTIRVKNWFGGTFRNQGMMKNIAVDGLPGGIVWDSDCAMQRVGTGMMFQVGVQFQ